MRTTPMRDLSDTEIARLQALLDDLAESAPDGAPLDVSALDGYLCGVLLQPHPVPEDDWWPFGNVTGSRAASVRKAKRMAQQPEAAPASQDTNNALRPLIRQRHAVLSRAVGGRRWFDPWIFELADDDAEQTLGPGHGPPAPLRASLLPWVAGFALAAERFPALMRQDAQALAEPLALLYQHFDADDLEGLEDEPALAAALASVEPPEDMAEAAEDLVRAVLLLADVSRPLALPAPRTAPARASPGPGQRSKSDRPGRARRG